MLKLRYFWKIAHTNDQSIAHRVFKHRKEQFLTTKYGFIHEAFNLCCKYDVIDFWHGKLKGLTNPASYIKKRIIAFSLKKDLEIGRKRPCAFTDIFLSNIFTYQKSYHLVEPYLKQDFFSSASARCLVTKFLIDSRAFYRKCIFCSQESKNIFLHHLFLCSKLEKQRHLLRSKLLLYNFPIEILGNKSIFYKTVLSRKVWTKCFSDFLADIDHRNQV